MMWVVLTFLSWIAASSCATLVGLDERVTLPIGGLLDKRPKAGQGSDSIVVDGQTQLTGTHLSNVQIRGFSVDLAYATSFAPASSDAGGIDPFHRMFLESRNAILIQDVVSEHIIPLTITSGISRSQKYLEALKETPSEVNTAVALTAVKNSKDEIFMAAIEVGGQKFYAALDTGSSDTWLMMKGFDCIKPPFDWLYKRIGILSCQFGPSYQKSGTFSQIPDRHFNISYVDGEYATGILGTDDVTLGNITLRGQILGFVNSLRWEGDGISSGNMGLGFPSITNAWNGTDFRKDKKGANIPYVPLFTNLYRKKIIKPYFSVALNRADEGPGMLALGGLPGEPIRHTGKFTRVPMQQLKLTANRPAPKTEDGFVDYTFYVANVDGFSINSKLLSPDSGSMQVMVDTGSRYCHFPEKIVDGLMGQWKPAPKKNAVGQWEVICDSSPPTFGIVFNGSTINFDKNDMIRKFSEKTCISTIQYAPGGDAKSKGLWLLGSPFFRSVVAVFDVGAAEMRFANRVR